MKVRTFFAHSAKKYTVKSGGEENAEFGGENV
jgi:hypothetical protein